MLGWLRKHKNDDYHWTPDEIARLINVKVDARIADLRQVFDKANKQRNAQFHKTMDTHRKKYHHNFHTHTDKFYMFENRVNQLELHEIDPEHDTE